MAYSKANRTLIRYKLTYPDVDFVVDVFTCAVSGVIGGLRPMRNVIQMQPLVSASDKVERFFEDLNITHLTYYRGELPQEEWESKIEKLQSAGYGQFITMQDGKIVGLKNLRPMTHLSVREGGVPKQQEVKIRVTMDWSVRPEQLARLGISPERLVSSLSNVSDESWDALVASASPEIVAKEIIGAS